MRERKIMKIMNGFLLCISFPVNIYICASLTQFTRLRWPICHANVNGYTGMNRLNKILMVCYALAAVGFMPFWPVGIRRCLQNRKTNELRFGQK